MNIIGLSGNAGSGKDFLTDRFFTPLGYYKFSLSWHFKVWIVGQGKATHKEVFVTKPPHIRKLLQEEGTERGRMIYGQNVWCDVMGEWFRVLEENCGIHKFIVPDIRFINEVEYVQSLGGVVFRIISPTRVLNNGLSTEAKNHISEIALNDYTGFDGHIHNDIGEEYSVESQISHLVNTFNLQ